MIRLIAAMSLFLAVAACEREDRSFQSPPPGPADQVVLSPLSPGQAAPVAANSGQGQAYESNAYHVSQGKRLFTWFNCVGCHGNGGGGSGPALMDDAWIYGNTIENIAATIREGRPNGMPSFRGKVPEEQIWQLSAYVRALGGLTSKDVPPGRNDDMQSAPGENRMVKDPFGPADAPPSVGVPNNVTPPSPAERAPL
ncbi:c-type cytochrome [Terrihabitans rhizophilus]